MKKEFTLLLILYIVLSMGAVATADEGSGIVIDTPSFSVDYDPVTVEARPAPISGPSTGVLKTEPIALFGTITYDLDNSIADLDLYVQSAHSACAHRTLPSEVAHPLLYPTDRALGAYAAI